MSKYYLYWLYFNGTGMKICANNIQQNFPSQWQDFCILTFNCNYFQHKANIATSLKVFPLNAILGPNITNATKVFFSQEEIIKIMNKSNSLWYNSCTWQNIKKITLHIWMHKVECWIMHWPIFWNPSVSFEISTTAFIILAFGINNKF